MNSHPFYPYTRYICIHIFSINIVFRAVPGFLIFFYQIHFIQGKKFSNSWILNIQKVPCEVVRFVLYHCSDLIVLAISEVCTAAAAVDSAQLSFSRRHTKLT